MESHLADLDKIGSKLVDCINIVESVLPLRRKISMMFGLTNTAATYQWLLTIPSQIRYGGSGADLQSLDCGHYPRRLSDLVGVDASGSTAHAREVFVVSSRENRPVCETVEAGEQHNARNADREAQR